MKNKKIKSLINLKIKSNYYIVIIFIAIGVVIFFSIANLVSIIELRKQVALILDSPAVSYLPKKNVEPMVLSEPEATSSKPVYDPETKTYANVISEPFFSTYLLDQINTNMRFDEKVTALTFTPVFTFKKEKNCEELFCNLLSNQNNELKEEQGQIFYGNKKIELPEELKDKKIVNFNFSQLEKKWVIGLVTIEEEKEVGYVYLFDGNNLETLITSKTPQKIKTQYDYKGGSISAGGSDNQFIVLYSGFEGLGYLYNNGIWQDLSQYFGLRVTGGGFKARILKGGQGNLANWYICSDTVGKPKFIKLWQNDTASIQGSIDLTKILGAGTAVCTLENNREVKIALNNFSSESNLYNFVDKGFNNDHFYRYQSLNLSDFVDKKIFNVRINSLAINAPENMYSLMTSNNLNDWQIDSNYNFVFDDISSSSAFYVKVDFKTRESEYSPWFGGLDNISYFVKDLK